MNRIPNGWEIIDFEKSLDKVSYTNKIQKKEFKTEGLYPIISQENDFINGYWNNKSDLYVVDKPIVLFGDHTQVLKYVDFDFVLGADGVKIIKPRDIINTKYLYYFLQNLSLGSLGYSRHYRLLKEICVLYPKSLIEQQRIVLLLDEAFSVIDKAKANAEKNLKNARELFDSYLNEIFEKRGEEWEERKLEEVCEIINGGTPDTTIPEFWHGENLWITPKDMGKLDSIYVDNTLRKISDEGLKNSSAKLLPPNSIILSSRAPIGHLAISTKPISTNQGCKGLIPKKGIDSLFIYFFLFKSVELLNNLGTGATFKELSGAKLRTVVIHIPSFQKQKTIVHQIEVLRTKTQRLESIYQKKIDDLDELRKSILEKAFMGEL
jgi:type I restriction enzyme S subunit